MEERTEQVIYETFIYFIEKLDNETLDLLVDLIEEERESRYTNVRGIDPDPLP